MTLNEYCDRNDVPLIRDTRTGSLHLRMPNTGPRPLPWQLFRLSDYAVSTISGPIVWIVPRS
jgi:hypothetical protein